ncbi:MAG: hypothetical protein A2Y63_01130 [Candidatus Riflebacteria bacterium RBG_13_59_9]|nr:MAG: hypothetical protein A2Y63_01130 [Candidatus Riflebacteria bacterium RBG_13_59_9]
MAKAKRTRLGFTLVELLVVISIIGILALIALPNFAKVRTTAREAQVARNLDIIHKALEQFGVDHNGLYPYRVHAYDASGTELLNTDVEGLYPVGIWGGVEVVFPDGSPNPTVLDMPYNEPQWPEEHSELFNQYSDPLRALGYLNEYPVNPFMRRSMGAILWSFSGNDVTIPQEGVIVCAGDFVYTYNMGDPVAVQNGNTMYLDREDPALVVTEAVTYTLPRLTAMTPAEFRVDLVDNYQLWVYGHLDLNGTRWAVYANNAFAAPTRAREPKQDWNGNGTRDEFERGLVGYFFGGEKFFEERTSTDEKVEY